MQRSFRRPVRLALAGFLAVAAAAACAACGGGSSGPGKVSLTAATANPCLLVSWSQARAILGHRTTRPTRGARGQCLFDSASAPLGQVVSVDIGPGPFSKLNAESLVTGPAPTIAGHGALCGKTQSGASGPTSLLGPFGPSHGLLIIGPSCAVDAGFARQIYLHLS
jgi:hypothetical protein